jgi:hypothetical protein
LLLDDGGRVLMFLSDGTRPLPTPGGSEVRVRATFEIRQRWVLNSGGNGPECRADDVVVDLQAKNVGPSVPSGWRDVCPAAVLDRGSIEGIFLGADGCDSDTCQARFLLDDGSEAVLYGAPGQAAKLFGHPGGRVKAEFELRSRWLREPMCWHPRRLVGDG